MPVPHCQFPAGFSTAVRSAAHRDQHLLTVRPAAFPLLGAVLHRQSCSRHDVQGAGRRRAGHQGAQLLSRWGKCWSFYLWVRDIIISDHRYLINLCPLCWIRTSGHSYAGTGQIDNSWSYNQTVLFRHVCSGAAPHLWGVQCQTDEAAAGRQLHVRSSHRHLRRLDPAQARTASLHWTTLLLHVPCFHWFFGQLNCLQWLVQKLIVNSKCTWSYFSKANQYESERVQLKFTFQDRGLFIVL